MMHKIYEYNIIDNRREVDENALNVLGLAGWRLIAVAPSPYATFMLRYVFMREVNNALADARATAPEE